jgi:hypothetical protein
LAAAATDGAEHVASLFTRAYEVLASGLHDRAVTSFTKVQALVETTAVGKTAAIAGAAAAMAGGGYATVERSAVERPVVRTPAATHGPRASSRPLKDSAARPVSAPSGGSSTTVGATRSSARREFGPLRARRTANRAPEFGATQEQLRAAASGATASSVGSSTSAPRAPEFAPQPRAAKSPEFGP